MSYSNSGTVNQPSCGYSSLNNLSSAQSYSLGPNVPASLNTAKYVVPNYSAPGYNTLTGTAAPSCSGYFSITNAYGAGAAQCAQGYSSLACASNLK